VIDVCKQSRTLYRLPVLTCLSVRTMATTDLYEAIQKAYPLLCDDAVRCFSRPSQALCRHAIRWCQQDLKAEGLVNMIQPYELWEITESGLLQIGRRKLTVNRLR
jgi:hypothetical protein